MHDLPPSTPSSLLPPGTPAPKTPFPWWKTSVVVVVGLTIVLSWLGTERTLVRPGSTEHVVEPVTYSPSQTQYLAQQYVSDPQSLSDDAYRAAALAREAELKRQRQQRKTVLYRNPINPHDRWQEQVNQLREDLSRIKEFPEGSVQWHMQQRLEGLLQEEPQR